jgi:YbbR domain-containing protein
LRNLSPSLAAEATPTAVDVAVRGSRETMARIDGDEIAAYVDLAGLGAGQYQLTVHADLARDAGVTRIEPSTVQIRITSGK